MIRFSALNLARHCGHAARLNAQHPESSEAALHGRERHRLIAGRILGTIKEPSTFEGVEAAVAFAREAMLDAAMAAGPVVIHVEEKVTLYDEDGVIIAEGTPDLVIFCADGFIHVVDWKSRLDGVEPAATNLQGIGYALASASTDGQAGSREGEFRVSFVGLSTGKAIVDSADFPANRGWELHEAVEAAATMPDEACVGNWCGGCYQRHYCHAWQARVQTGAALMLAPKGGDFAITSETAPALFERIADIRKAADMAEEILRAEILAGTVVCEIDGKRLTPVQTAGRKSPDIDALLAAGVDVPMKQGKNYVTWKMLKVKS